MEVSSIGRFTRKELLERLFLMLSLYEFIIEDPGIRVTVENTAVFSYRCHERLNAGKKQIEGTFRVSATYTREGKQYQLSVWDIRLE